MIENNLKFDLVLNKMLIKMATAIGSTYLLRYLMTLKEGIVLFKSLVPSYFNFSSIFLQSLAASSLLRINRHKLGNKFCYVRKKFDSARDLLTRDKILPAELFIKKSDSIKRYKGISQISKKVKVWGTNEMTENSQTFSFFPKNTCQSTWSDRSIVRNFWRKWNNMPIEIRKEKTKNKFNEKITREMIKLHQRVPIDREVQGLRSYFY